MRGHIVRAFGVVDVGGVAVGGKAGKNCFEVAAHIGIGVLAEDQRGAGVLQENGAHTFVDAAFRDCTRNLGRDFSSAAAAGAEGEGGLENHGRAVNVVNP